MIQLSLEFFKEINSLRSWKHIFRYQMWMIENEKIFYDENEKIFYDLSMILLSDVNPK